MGAEGNSKPHSSATLVFFSGSAVVGAALSVRRPRGARASGVRVNEEKKRKLVVVYREVMKIIIKYSLSRAGGQGGGGD